MMHVCKLQGFMRINEELNIKNSFLAPHKIGWFQLDYVAEEINGQKQCTMLITFHGYRLPSCMKCEKRMVQLGLENIPIQQEIP